MFSRFGDGSSRKKSSSSILNSSQHLVCSKCNIFMTRIQRSLKIHSYSCTGAPVKKQFGFISNNQHNSNSSSSLNRIVIPRRVSSKHSPSISQMLFSNENSNRKDLSLIPNSQTVDDCIGDFFGCSIFYFPVDVVDSSDLVIPKFLLERCRDGRTVQQCIDAGCGIIAYINDPDDTHFFALKSIGGEYVIKDPYHLQYQTAGSHGFCQIFALMIATDNDRGFTLDVNLNNWIGFQSARSIVDTMADSPLIRASMVLCMDTILDVNDFDVFRRLLFNIVDCDILDQYCIAS